MTGASDYERIKEKVNCMPDDRCTESYVSTDNEVWQCTKQYGHTEQHSYSPRENPVTPTYYQGDYVMCIIEDFKLDFLRGTVVKYLLRAGNKVKDSNAISSRADDSELVDLKKAAWYLDRKIKQLEKETKTK